MAASDVTLADYFKSLKDFNFFLRPVWEFKQPNLICTLPLELWQIILTHCDDDTVWILFDAVASLQTLAKTSPSLRALLCRTTITMEHVTTCWYSGCTTVIEFPRVIYMMKMPAFWFTTRRTDNQLSCTITLAHYRLFLDEYTEHGNVSVIVDKLSGKKCSEECKEHLVHIGQMMMDARRITVDFFLANLEFGLFFGPKAIMKLLERKRKLLSSNKS